MKRSRNLAWLLLAFAVATMGVARADCRVHNGDRVVLYGTTDDPDVFVWDSRFRLRAYAGGSFDVMHALLPHARLLSPGTRATVESCVTNFVQAKYTSSLDDAIGIVILTGPMRGQRGWVIGSSVREENRSGAFLNH